ncbi:hypothetical protein L1A45_11775 [Acinetobacter variabilis]|uniref:hypothetical protein n=1 Tax=Acinetobacter variabilis TaxID=70346 RepID=UPI00376FEDCC
MAQIKAKFQFRKSYLAMMIGLGLLPSAHAMQELTDSSLSDTTGEGVALVLDDFKMVFQAPNDASSGSSYRRGIDNPGQADTGFIRIIPTGENYNQLGERVYNKIYDTTYNQSLLDGKAANNYNTFYETTYQKEFDLKYSELETRYTKDIAANEQAKSSTIRTEFYNAIYDSAVMQEYYNQRYNDYYNGAGEFGLGDYRKYPLEADGTTAYELDPVWDAIQRRTLAEKHATANRHEMVELLFGKNADKAIPNSSFLQSIGLSTRNRSNDIDGAVTNYINQQIADKTASAKAQAKSEADKLAAEIAKELRDELYQIIVDVAINAAKTAASGGSVEQLRTKADVFIYGLALSKSDDSLSTRYSDLGFNWGTASNPWLFHAGAETVKQFTDTGKEVGYLALEAPLATVAANEADNNIKLGFWTDIFSRSLNSSNTVDYATGAPTSGLDISERFRAQFIANGVSMNGSQVRLFQTLTSPDLAYNQTLGLASLIRLNTNDDPSTLTSDSNNLNSKGIRISSAAKENNLDGDGPTPALNNSVAPIFHDTEGLYLYSPNINLVLGSMYQPFVVGSEGNNIILEVTRIPKISDIYNRIYQRYPDGKGGFLGSEALLGSTCNVYTCGTEIKAQASDSIALYQGRDATHSSIAIGSVERIANTNMLKAKDDNNATGVVFRGATDNSTRNFGSAVIDGVLIQHLKIKTTGL